MRVTVTRRTETVEVWHIEAASLEAGLAWVQAGPDRPADKVFSMGPTFDRRQDEDEVPGPRVTPSTIDRSQRSPQ